MREPTILLLSVVLVGCASSVDDDFPLDSISKYIQFSPMFSAFDGAHDYALTPNVPSAGLSNDLDPVLATSIKWEVDGAFVKREDFRDLPAAIKLTTKKAGVTTVAITAKSLSGHAFRSEAKLTISRAKQSEWDAGEARYNDGEMSPSMRRTITVDGQQCPMGLAIDLPRASACSECHNPMSTFTFQDTPTQTAGYSNEDLIQIFTQGAKPVGGIYRSTFLRAAPMPDCIYKEFHMWEMTDDEKNGVVWKLRSISPKIEEEQQ